MKAAAFRVGMSRLLPASLGLGTVALLLSVPRYTGTCCITCEGRRSRWPRTVTSPRERKSRAAWPGRQPLVERLSAKLS